MLCSVLFLFGLTTDAIAKFIPAMALGIFLCVMRQFISDMVDRTEALKRGEARYLWFDNLNITYNPDNVEGIEIVSIGVKQVEALNDTGLTVFSIG